MLPLHGGSDSRRRLPKPQVRGYVDPEGGGSFQHSSNNQPASFQHSLLRIDANHLKQRALDALGDAVFGVNAVEEDSRIA